MILEHISTRTKRPYKDTYCDNLRQKSQADNTIYMIPPAPFKTKTEDSVTTLKKENNNWERQLQLAISRD